MRPLVVALIALSAAAGCVPNPSAIRRPDPGAVPVAIRPSVPIARQINGGFEPPSIAASEVSRPRTRTGPRPQLTASRPTVKPSIDRPNAPQDPAVFQTSATALVDPPATRQVPAAKLPVDPPDSARPGIVKTPRFEPDNRDRRERGTPIMIDAARVNDTIITVRELKRLVLDKVGGADKLREIPTQGQNMIAKNALEALIDRALLVQAARKKMDKPEKWDAFKQYVEKKWQTEELPKLMEREKVDNEIDLAHSYEARDDTLEDAHDAYLLETISQEYVGLVLHDKIERAEPKEIYRYYTDHLATFQRSAQVNWREIFVPAGPEAAATIAEARARIERGEDFAAVAKQVSKSPKAEQGGLWQTAPDAFAVPTVREALAKLTIGTLSKPLEASDGLYLIRVESRRPAGPRPFSEVQKEIDEAILQSRFLEEMDAMLVDLRKSAAISSPLFEGTDSALEPSTGPDPAGN